MRRALGGRLEAQDAGPGASMRWLVSLGADLLSNLLASQTVLRDTVKAGTGLCRLQSAGSVPSPGSISRLFLLVYIPLAQHQAQTVISAHAFFLTILPMVVLVHPTPILSDTFNHLLPGEDSGTVTAGGLSG